MSQEFRKLGEQWVEEINGEMHMLKAVNYTEGCNGCVFLRYDPDEFYTCNRCRLGCPVDDEKIIKDLGVLNKEGLLPCPFCGEYPKIKYGVDGSFWHYIELCCCKYVDRMDGYSTDMEGFYKGIVERWNRRM